MTSFEDTINELVSHNSLRLLEPLTTCGNGKTVLYKDRELLNLSSNDYLGLANDLEYRKRFYRELVDDRDYSSYGLGIASSRLLTGDQKIAHDLEKYLAHSYNREDCQLFNSGYHANIGVFQALLKKNDLIISDKANHASIHDGLLLSRAQSKRFRHGDLDHLEYIIRNNRDKFNRVLIAVESVFSMDGDCFDLFQLVELKKKYDCMLYVDEAHAVGVYGAKGLGKCEEKGLVSEIDFLVGTFGKAFGSIGAFVVCSTAAKKMMINFSRSLIYTTALPPVILKWNSFILQNMANMDEKRTHLHCLTNKLRVSFAAHGIVTSGETNIIPVIIGSDSDCVSCAKSLQEKGYYVLPIRPPTVPKGTSRLRLSLTSNMSWDDLKQLPSDFLKVLL